MKRYLFLLISILIHSIIVAILLVRFDFGFYRTGNQAYVQLDDRKTINMDVERPFIISDEASTNRKPVINTNFAELQKEDRDAGGSSGLEGYIPGYRVEELPVPLSPISPKYPEEARRTGIEGRVILLLYIDESGIVKKVEVQKSPSEILSKSAVEAVSSARFKPARIAGSPRAVRMLLTLKFHLE